MVRTSAAIKKDTDEQVFVAAQKERDVIDFKNRPHMLALRNDLRRAATNLDLEEVKYLVNYYYTFQRDRIRNGNRIKAFEKNKKQPVAVISTFSGQMELMEKLMIVPLLSFVENNTTGTWLLERKGIGPVLAAGLLAHLVVKREYPQEGTDIMRIETFSKVSQWWRFAGYDPTLVWEKGHKRPWNAKLKTLLYKVGKSFVMVGGGDIYRELYDKRKAYAEAKNKAGGYKATADLILERLNKKRAVMEKHEAELQEHAELTDATVENHDEDPLQLEEDISKFRALLEKGMITPAAIDAQSRRWTVQMFMSHLHTVMWEVEMGRSAALPYAKAHLNPDQHFEFIPVPGYVTLEQQKTAKYFPPHGIILSDKK